jgi:hypothetical protein
VTELSHVTFARAVLQEAEADVPHAFLRRAQLAALPAVPAQSVIEVPAFLMDLGLRRWRDPAWLFTGTLERNPGWTERWAGLRERQGAGFDAAVRAWEGGAATSADLVAGLESLVIFTGDDAAAIRFADAIASGVRGVDSARLAIGLAAIASIEDPPEALRRLETAGAVACTPLGRFLIELRKVALYIKRLQDYGAARALITELGTVADGARDAYVVSEADAAAMHALLLNLRALVEVREDDILGAVETMREAAAIMPEDGFVIVPEEMADRYRAQVRINLVQSLWLSGRATEALQRINAHVTITRTEHPYSLSEALLVAAYFSFLGGECAMAVSYCMEAERLVSSEGTPTRLAMCRRIATGSLARLGKRRRAEILARQMAKDPLGDHRLV